MPQPNLSQIVDALKSVLPTQGPLALHEPRFEGNEWKYVKDCLDTGWVSSVGKYVDRFEKDLADYIGAKYAVATCNGTAALHISLLLAGVKSGDEVLVPTFSFVATGNAVLYCGATPHFIDLDPKTLGVDVPTLDRYLAEITEVRGKECLNRKTGRRIRAMVPVHIFGHPVDLDACVELSEKYHIAFVEDSAESLGSYYKGKHTGNWGLVAAFSFNGNKIATTGGGGAIVTQDPELAKLAKHLTTTARVAHPWEFSHDQLGYNYRLPNLNAALGCAQLEVVPRFLEQKRNLAKIYQAAFQSVSGVEFLTEPPNTKSNYWLNTLLLDSDHESDRDALLEMTHKAGFMTRPAWQLLHTLPMFSSCPRAHLDQAEKIRRRLINLPSSPFLGKLPAVTL